MSSQAVKWTVIVIPVWNQFNYTMNSVPEILRFTQGDFKLVVVDNGSTDITPVVLREIAATDLGINLHVITNEENRGYGPALNQGFRWGLGQGASYFVALNNDIKILEEDWLQTLIGPLVETPRRLVGARIIDFNEATRFNGKIQPYVEGWCFVVARAFFDDVGFLDEALAPAWYEDVDLTIRAVKAGYQVMEHPAFVWDPDNFWRMIQGPIFHFYGKTGFELIPRAEVAEISIRNRDYLIQKHFQKSAIPESAAIIPQEA